MNATAFGGRPQQVITAENLLFDAAERAGRMREGRLALHIHLSRLLAHNRSEAKVRIAFRLFQAMVDVYRGQIFLLTNNDIVLICKDARLADIDAIVGKLRALFAKDPLTYTEGPGGADRFATFYDLEVDFDPFFRVCTDLVEEAKRRVAAKRAAPVVHDLDATQLAKVLGRLGSVDLAQFARRQPCVRLTDRNLAEVLFQEFFFSIGDLQKAVAPEVNLYANRWLFQHLSEVLDLHMLATVQAARFQRIPAAYSLNLNLATMEKPSFQRFLSSLAGRAGLLVEVQLIDIFGGIDRFFRIQEQLRPQGVTFVLDGMGAVNFHHMDAELYHTDFIKVVWSADIAIGDQGAELIDALRPIGMERVILCRCDGEAAVAWGVRNGIRLFQGNFIDSMVSAVTMAQCGKAAACTLAQCTRRHGVVTGPLRAECGDNAMLDAFPTLKRV